MEVVLHQGVGEDERQVGLLLRRLHPRRGTFFSGGGRLLRLVPRALHLLESPKHGRLLRLTPCALHLLESLVRGPKDLVETVEVATGPPATAAGERATLPRLHFAPLLHWRAKGGAPRLPFLLKGSHKPKYHINLKGRL